MNLGCEEIKSMWKLRLKTRYTQRKKTNNMNYSWQLIIIIIMIKGIIQINIFEKFCLNKSGNGYKFLKYDLEGIRVLWKFGNSLIKWLLVRKLKIILW